MGRPDSVIEVHYTTRQLAKLLDKEGTQAGGVPRRGHNKPIVRMGGTGLEPVTPSLSSWCSSNCSNRPGRCRLAEAFSTSSCVRAVERVDRACLADRVLA